MRKITVVLGLGLVAFSAACRSADAPTAVDDVRAEFARNSGQVSIGINVLLNGPATDEIIADLSRLGTVTGQIAEIQAVFLAAPRSALDAIRNLPYVAAANPNAARSAGPPLPPVEVGDFAAGLSTWDLDAVDVTDLGVGRAVQQDGSGVYVGVLDTGLLDSWRYYFPAERIAVELARSFTGSPVSVGTVATQPNKWEHDTNSHGTHVTSTILGYNLGGNAINGVAPKATVVPVKVLNNNGGGWSSMVARGIVYMTDLKDGALGGAPVVVNLSLSGPALDAVEKAAIDYAIGQGVIVVAAAGNAGSKGMGYPGAYAPVISVGASGWEGEWLSDTWPLTDDVADPTSATDFYVVDFSAREMAGQDLDVLAPGSWVLGPWQTNRGQVSYFFVGGTSQATPHVAGIVALMAQKAPGLTASEAESILESTAVPLPPGSLSVMTPFGTQEEYMWGADATGSGLAVAEAALAAVSGGP